jgi:1,4-dihydroxy-2-naphthoate octaprenyltransferase
VRALAAFVRLGRPLFLYGGFAGVALGAAVAVWSGHRLDAASYAWAQTAVTAFQLMVHYANDYFDRDGDRAGARTSWSGGSGVLAEGTLPPHVALVAALVCASAGAVASAHFALAGNAVAAAIGIAIGVLSWAYSAPPLRLEARGLGEIDAAAVVGVLVPALAYAAFTSTADAHIARAVAVPFVAMLVMMLSVELPDAGADRETGKGTLVVRFGIAQSWNILAYLTIPTLLLAAGEAISLRTVLGSLAIVPAVIAGLALVRAALRDPRPATLAFLGVAFYALTVTGLAAAYAAAAAR